MHRRGHNTLIVRLCGFIVHPQEGWLGSSPDGIVMNSSSNACKSLLEVKCPHAKHDMSPEEACKDPNFYYYISDKGVFTLKRSHWYYHQVQLQLYVLADFCEWCDFCVFTTN